jgi:hypothetical protein
MLFCGPCAMWVGGVMYVVRRMLAFVGPSQYFVEGSSIDLPFLRVDCEFNRPFFLATVFRSAAAFNGNLSRWDVATVTSMPSSKSIRIVENDLT